MMHDEGNYICYLLTEDILNKLQYVHLVEVKLFINRNALI